MQVQRIRVVRPLLKNLPIAGFRLLEAATFMVLNRFEQQLLFVGHIEKPGLGEPLTLAAAQTE